MSAGKPIELCVHINVTGKSTREMATTLAEQIRQRVVPRLTRPAVAVESASFDARRTAEEKVRVILDECDDRTQALLFHLLQCAGWTRDRAELVLRKARWWLG